MYTCKVYLKIAKNQDGDTNKTGKPEIICLPMARNKTSGNKKSLMNIYSIRYFLKIECCNKMCPLKRVFSTLLQLNDVLETSKEDGASHG